MNKKIKIKKNPQIHTPVPKHLEGAQILEENSQGRKGL